LGGSLEVEGLALSVTLNGGVGTVDGGGQSTNILVNSGGTLTINSLSSATSSTVTSGGTQILAGGSAKDTQLDGGNEAVGSGGVDQAATINSGSRLGVDSGGMANLTAIKNGGYEGVLSGGTASNVGISLGGTLEVDSGGTILSSINLGGTLIIDDLSDKATVNFGSAGQEVFGYMYFYPGGTARIANDTLTVSDNGTIFTQALTGNYSDYTPVIEDVSLYGVDVVGVILEPNTAPCFAAGTRILTPRGEIAVENLVIGDMVITKEGDDAPIKWIGKRKLDLSRHPHPEQAQPIFFEADCLAEGVPSRELILSPDHALYLDGVLVPAKALVNGENIRQLNRQTVTYYHIELEKHSIIFSENTPVETYLETGNRGAFENGTDALTLHPDLAQTMREEQSCAPFVETGPVVWAIRIRTLERQYSTYKSGQRRYNA
jgi:autotransporter passenger strand-loop-strand repeat protein